MNKLSEHSSQTGIDINQLIAASSNFHPNVGQEIVVVTEDKLELCLIKHQNTLKAKNDWKTPVGIFLALLSSLIAAEFTEFLTLSADTWKALFIFCCILSGIWSIIAIIKAIRSVKNSDPKKIINELKRVSN